LSAALALGAGGGVAVAADEVKAKPPAAESGASGWIFATDGKLRTGTVKVGDGGLSVDGGLVPVDQIIAGDFGVEAPAIIDQGLLLTDGTLMHGSVRSLQATTLGFSGDLVGARDFATAAVSAVVVSPMAVAEFGDLPADFTGAILANGDRVAGDPAFINAKMVGIDNHRRVVQLARVRVLAVVLHAIAHGGPLRQWARLANGDRMDATAFGAKGVVLAVPGNGAAGGAPVTVPNAFLRGLAPDGGKFQSLLGLTATATVGRQTFGENAAPAPVRSDEWPHAAGLRFEHAIASPAGGEIAYDIGGKYTTFFAIVAPADDSSGSPDCRVLVDGHQVFASGALTAPTAITVSVSGGKELRLVVANAANAQDGAPAATALWGEPVLAK
jgi:hypothetical protein